MPEANAARANAGGGGQQGQQQRQDGGFTWKTLLNSLLIAYAVNMLVGQFTGRNKASNVAPVPKFEEGAAPKPVIGGDFNPIPEAVAPIWSDTPPVDIRVYVHHSSAIPSFKVLDPKMLVLSVDNFQMGNYSDTRTVDTTFPVPIQVQKSNSPMFAHVFVAKNGHELDPKASKYSGKDAYHVSRQMNHLLAKKKVVKTKKLLGGDDTDVPDDVVQDPSKGPVMASYYHPNFTLALIPDSGVMRYEQVPPASRQWLWLETSGARDASGKNGWYYPIVYLNTFWQLRDYMTELNSTVQTLPLHIDLNNMANWKFNIYANIDENIKSNQRNAASGGTVPGGGDGSEFEEMKRILIDTNVYLLSTTAVVTVLHTIFEMLAFKNDVSHWRSKKDNVGISVRTILANVFMQLVIFLYLFDNSDGTSWMILFGQGMGILLEAWKITKTVDVRIRPGGPDSILPYTIKFEDKYQLSETEQKTQEYDKEAFKYLYMVGVPLLIGYAIYSVLYDTHKGWYSFIITTLVGSVYAYGFLMMVPSLYINYRLQSVAHMPGRAMMYKVLNTFIDDLFAFTIKMPTLHRLATLRDDVIFFVYVYQSWKYKVDHTRVNEFGQGGDEEELEEKKANKPLAAAPEADTSASAKASGVDAGSATKRKTQSE